MCLDVVGGNCSGEQRCDVQGFLGSQAGFGADLNLLTQIAMGLALLAGARLARNKRYAAHGGCQATVLILNLVPIALVMWPSFHSQVVPVLAKHFGRRYYRVATVHGVLGTVAEILGVYILDGLCGRRHSRLRSTDVRPPRGHFPLMKCAP